MSDWFVKIYKFRIREEYNAPIWYKMFRHYFNFIWWRWKRHSNLRLWYYNDIKVEVNKEPANKFLIVSYQSAE